MYRRGAVVYRRRWATSAGPSPRERQARIIWASSADLGDEGGMRASLLDYRLHPTERWHMIWSLATSFCANTRELLFGVSPRRLDYLELMDESAAPDGRRLEWTGFQRERLNGWMTDPVKQLQLDNPEAAQQTHGADVLGWVGLHDMRARMKYCATF